VINATRTAMGARTLRRWITRPLVSREAIFERHDAVDELTRSRAILEQMNARLARIADLERLVSRITLRSATPRECLTLADSLLAVDELAETMAPLQGPLLVRMQKMPASSHVVARISATIDDTPPMNVRDGGAIRAGVDADLDSLRTIARDSKSVLMEIEAAEKQRTGISSLKVRFNSVFGYYIEVSKSNLARVPPDYIRKQTLVNAERFITPELKVLEEKIVGAEEKANAIEIRLYDELLEAVAKESPSILATARAVAEIDALSSLATIAVRNRYVRAQLSEEPEIAIEDGRHPVIEQLVSERFIPQSHRHPSRPQRHPGHHRPEHGRQVDVSAPGRADRAAQSGRLVRAGGEGAARHLRPDLHARRRFRSAGARRVDVHGGDARNGEHSQQRHRPLADHPR